MEKLNENIKAVALEQVRNYKVAIVGFAPSWNLAPYDDRAFDVWGINELYLQAKGRRFTHWFEIHDPESPSKKNDRHQSWLTNCKIPLYMQRHFPKFSASIPYPRKEIKEMVGENFILEGCGSPYTDYSNQITWMVLLAIYQGYNEIHIYGVDMAQQSEYSWQRSACQFAVGFAVGRGIKVLIPKTSELCKYPRDYGFETDNANRFMMKDRVKTLQNTAMNYQSQIHDLEFQYKQKHADFEIFKKNTADNLTKIGDEMVKLDIILQKNKEMINFLQTMPQDLDTINTKKIDIIANVTKQNKVMEDGLKDFEKRAKELQLKLTQEGKLDYMNLQILETSKKNLEKQINAAGGAIGECNYNLSNNRV